VEEIELDAETVPLPVGEEMDHGLDDGREDESSAAEHAVGTDPRRKPFFVVDTVLE
jgi:hypothetical protein